MLGFRDAASLGWKIASQGYLANFTFSEMYPQYRTALETGDLEGLMDSMGMGEMGHSL
jgi:hypothetical protein